VPVGAEDVGRRGVAFEDAVGDEDQAIAGQRMTGCTR
jgi:hypothetical protein